MFVKICGITTEQDALLAVGMGADAIGFVFAPSPRQVTVHQARDIARRLPGGIMTVGVFRNELPKRVSDIVAEAGLHTAQLHGRESAEDSRWVSEHVPQVIKAFVAGDPAIERVGEYGASAMLVEGPTPGSGEVFDWTLLDGTQRGVPLILSGGLTPDNVATAISLTRPWGVDVSTGVEAAPGRKDPTKVRDFVRAAREAAESLPDADVEPLDPPPYDWRDESR